MKKVGFIGIGVMGKSMARHLMQHGYEVSVYNRTQKKAQEILDEGAIWCASAGECAKGQDAVITIVGYPKDVEEVYFGAGGVIENAKPGAYLIDMTTTSPRLSQEIFRQAAAKGLHALDAPVSGGDTGAKNATLAIMVGGEKEAFDACLPLFEAMGKNIVYQGPAGSGQHCKMANQIVIAGTIAGVCEAIAYAKAQGLDPDVMLDTISTGAAGSWQLSNNGAQILKGNMDPGFFIKHFIKDMSIATEEAAQRGLDLGVLDQTLQMYRELEADGLGDLGTQALIRYYDKK
ncbi:MAG: NAD(P)-dependent oxidoreductase [Oscillospiraceae bacterium]|nr:NAD(P)-dependent oxidoreductase [Oscillospiraceae bacterium]